MNDSEILESLREPLPREPKLSVRLVWWFGVYLAGALFLPVFVIRGMNFTSVGAVLLSPFYFALIFPCGLGVLPLYPISWIFPVEPNLNPASRMPLTVIIFVLSYLAYIYHLRRTIKSRTRRAFRTLMIILLVMVSLNVAGCYAFLADDPKPAVYHSK